MIGGGPGGYAAALYGALAGPRIAVVERDKVGGVCLHRGCIPAKQFLETASVARTVAGAKDLGVQAGQPLVDFAVSQRRKQEVVGQLYKGRVGLMMRDDATFGITWYAQEALGEVVFFDPPEVGGQVTKDQPDAQIESVKAVSACLPHCRARSSRSTTRSAVRPRRSTRTPYGQGWLKVKLSDPTEADSLMSAGEYKATLAS